MATPIYMPKVDMDQETGTITEWLKRDGDQVEKGEAILVIETDKVAVDVESPATGIIRGIRGEIGQQIPIAEIIAYVLDPGESLPESVEQEKLEEQTPAPKKPVPAVSATPVARRMAADMAIDLDAVGSSRPDGKITREDVERYQAKLKGVEEVGQVRATPAARRVARERGIDLLSVTGSGPRGRIQEADVLSRSTIAASVEPVATGTGQAGEPTIIKLEGMRATIARRLQASYQEAPHITFTTDIDMSAANALRDYANKQQPSAKPRVSMTALLVKICAWVLGKYPLLNSHLVDDQIISYPKVNMGIAVALEEGLIVPVLPDAGNKGLLKIGEELAYLVERARTNKLHAADLSGSTFTISNLGMFGVDRFTAILNPPEVGILAIGRTVDRFVPGEQQQPLLRPLMTVTLSVDHRVIDGATAAQFIATLRETLEMPSTILL